MHTRSIFGIFLLIVLICVGTIPVSAGSMVNLSDSGIVIHASNISKADDDGDISSVDILPLLKKSESDTISMPESLAIFTIEAGKVFSPSAIRPETEVLYIINGSAQVSVDEMSLSATTGDAVLIPRESVMMVENIDSTPLTYLSVISASLNGSPVNQTLLKRSVDNTPLISFGNESDSASFSVRRLFSTFEEPLPLSFDLAVATLPAGKVIGNHYLTSGQLGYVLSGEGNVSIGCTHNPISKGDIAYTPPYAVQGFDAREDLNILLITEPFYQPEQDYPVPDACPDKN